MRMQSLPGLKRRSASFEGLPQFATVLILATKYFKLAKELA